MDEIVLIYWKSWRGPRDCFLGIQEMSECFVINDEIFPAMKGTVS